MELPKPIQNFINETPISKIGFWLQSLMTFYIKPLRFFTDFYSQNVSDRVKQCILYILLFIVIIVVFTGSETMETARIVISLFFITVPISTIIYLAATILRFDHLVAIRSISFSYISFLLWLTPAFLFTWIFIKNEDYTFLYIANIFNSVSIVFTFCFFWFIIHAKPLRILAAFCLSLILLNVLMFALSFINIGEERHDGIGFDPIVNEINGILPDLKSYPGIIYTRTTIVELGKKRIDSISILNNDTLTHFGQEGVNLYRHMAKINVRKIDSIIKVAKFNRTKHVLKPLRDFYFLINTYFDYPACDTCLIKSQVISNHKTGLVLKETKEYVIDDVYLQDFKKFEKNIKILEEDVNRANNPLTIPGVLLYPYYFVGDLLGKKTIHVYTNL
ncbi:hypothetical protein [Mucilaginibacter glaciei]|uniref:Uncharacterized protein n=1 Tax=Mucilaginibacter glaciei TaxID=2772109 RepID=A0A926S3E9_9SPHI|nr:hypothetical protein [Mucilaginibacter glaciei]MBD1394164.1 hypothetical protein [Mucilaginibacter glaciei]